MAGLSYADRCRSYQSTARASCAPSVQRDFRRIDKFTGPGTALRFASRIAGRNGSFSPTRLIVLRDGDRAETWAFASDEVFGVQNVPRNQLRSVPSTLANPTIGFSQAVFSWNDQSVGLIDEQRVFTTLRSLGA